MVPIYVSLYTKAKIVLIILKKSKKLNKYTRDK